MKKPSKVYLDMPGRFIDVPGSAVLTVLQYIRQLKRKVVLFSHVIAGLSLSVSVPVGFRRFEFRLENSSSVYNTFASKTISECRWMVVKHNSVQRAK